MTANLRLERRFPLVARSAILAFLVAGNAAVAHAATPLGPNLSFTTSGAFSGSGGCPFTPIITVDASATNPGFTVTNPTPTCTVSPGSLGGTVTYTFTALNGFQIDDISATLICGKTGGDTGSVTVGSLFTLTCPTEATVGATSTLSNEATFAATPSDVVPFTLAGSSVAGGSVTIDSFTLNVSLVPSAVPEPAAWALMLAGVGLVGATRRTMRRAGAAMVSV